MVKPNMVKLIVPAVVGVLLSVMSFAAHAQAPAPSESKFADPLRNGPLIWDANHDGVYTCDEWKKFADQIFTVADRNRDGFLDAAELPVIRKTDPSFAEAELGYFDDNGDGKISRKEFVEKPSPFIMRNDRNGDREKEGTHHSTPGT